MAVDGTETTSIFRNGGTLSYAGPAGYSNDTLLLSRELHLFPSMAVIRNLKASGIKYMGVQVN
jgi:hypothetical protein